MSRPSKNTRAREACRPIFRAVAASYGLSEADLYVRDRTAHVTAARHVAWALCRRAGFTLEAVAAIAGWDQSAVRDGAARGLDALRQTKTPPELTGGVACAVVSGYSERV